jgi:glutathione S-transferase
MYALHIANKNYSSWSLRPWVLMKTLGIPFEEVLTPFPAGGSYATFRGFSPTGLVPLLRDGDIAVWESLAIVEYLAESHAKVWPADKAARAFARSGAAEMHSGFSALRGTCGMNVGVRVRLREITPALKKDLDRLDELWGEALSRFGGPVLGGAEFTAFDAFFCPVAFRVQSYGLKLDPESMAYVERLLALPAMQEWYAAGIAEHWRDLPHDAELAQAGEVTADLRAPAA